MSQIVYHKRSKVLGMMSVVYGLASDPHLSLSLVRFVFFLHERSLSTSSIMGNPVDNFLRRIGFGLFCPTGQWRSEGARAQNRLGLLSLPDRFASLLPTVLHAKTGCYPGPLKPASASLARWARLSGSLSRATRKDKR